jgi:acetate kinase
MTEFVLTLNAGSSSIKFALFSAATLDLHGRGGIENLGGEAKLHYRPTVGAPLNRALAPNEARDHHAALDVALATLGQATPGFAVAAVGHRIVHGGRRFSAPALITDPVLDELRRLAPLAPLHQPHNLAGVDAARALFPDAPQIACFDTAFHRGHDFVNDAYGLPRSFYDDGLRRYGFHGLSYEYVSERLKEIAPDVAGGRVIIAHLGNGASMCAVRDSRSVATTMGFSTLDGLPMGTRPGQIDPGVLIYLMSARGYDVARLTDLLYKKSGLAGLSEVSNDWREVEATKTPQARDAIAYFIHRIVYEVGGLTAALQGLDALVFTGGIGENSASLRAAVVARLGWLGVTLDEAANAQPATQICAPDSRVRVYAIATDEERRIAQHTKATAQIPSSA